MKAFALGILFTLSSAVAVTAQTNASYQVDNFDFPNCVRVEKPPQPTMRRNARAGKSRLKMAHEPIASMNSLPLTRLTSMAIGRSLDGFTTGDTSVDTLIVESGTRNSVDPVLLYAIMHQESTFKRRAISPKGARGLMQLMPGTAARYGVTNIFDPRQNIEGGGVTCVSCLILSTVTSARRLPDTMPGKAR